MHYTNHNHPEYDKFEQMWTFSWDQYTGEYALPEKIGTYLAIKEQRETQKAYQERQELTDPVLYFPECVDSLNGIVGSNEEDDKREWGALGNPEQASSIAYSLIHNADSNGMNWNPLFKQVGIRLSVMHKIWGLVEGVITDEEGGTVKQGSIKLINPQAVVNWWPSEGNPQQVLVKEKADLRSGINDTEGDDSEVFVLYSLDGWRRFRIEKYQDGEGETRHKEVEINSGEYEYWADQGRTMRTLPIWPTEIPMPRNVGHLLAKKQNHIFNKKSRRDFATMNMSFSILQVSAESEQYNDMISNLEKGYNIVRLDPDAKNPHAYLSPDSTYLKDYGEILEQDKIDFYNAAFKQYGDAAKQVTATQIRLESRSGIEAFLSLLVSAVDEFESNCLWRLMQVYHKNNPSVWGSASVKRSRNFQAEDINEAMNQLSSSVLNADRAEAMSLETKVRTLHPEWSDDDVKAEVKRINKERGVPDPLEVGD